MMRILVFISILLASQKSYTNSYKELPDTTPTDIITASQNEKERFFTTYPEINFKDIPDLIRLGEASSTQSALKPIISTISPQIIQLTHLESPGRHEITFLLIFHINIRLDIKDNTIR